MKVEVNIGDAVWIKNTKKYGLVRSQMEREPLETELWFEVMDEDGKLHHLRESEFDVDMFPRWEELPENIQAILQKYADEDEDYNNLAAMLLELEAEGYTFEYYLTAEPYALRKI